MTDLSRRAIIAGLVAWPLQARAHGGHSASAWLKSAAWDGPALRLVVEVLNEGGGAVTLRALTCVEAEAVVLTRRRSVLGLATEQRVGSVRLVPNQLARLGEEPYRLQLVGVDAGAAELSLILDFGPDGSVGVVVPVPPR